MHRLLGPVVCLLLCVSAFGQRVSPRAIEAVQTIRELRAIGIPDDDQNNPPAKVPGLLRKLNKQLLALITETINDKKRRGIVSAEEIYAKLRAAGWNELPESKWDAYGEIKEINIQSSLAQYGQELLTASTQLWVPCGNTDPDSALYIFQGRAPDWKLILTTDTDFDTPDYLEMSGMQFSLSPPDRDGHWFLVVAHTPPTCRSAPSDLHYKVLRPGSSPDHPEVVFQGIKRLDPRFSPMFRLHTEDDEFSITTGKTRKLDGEPGVSILRYNVVGDKVTRTQPLALTAEDFIDEWAQLNWNDASFYSTKLADANLQEWHGKLEALADDSTEIMEIQHCPQKSGADASWLVDLWIDQKQNPSSNDQRLYIDVSERNHVLYVDSVTPNRPADCLTGKIHRTWANWELPDW